MSDCRLGWMRTVAFVLELAMPKYLAVSGHSYYNTWRQIQLQSTLQVAENSDPKAARTSVVHV